VSQLEAGPSSAHKARRWNRVPVGKMTSFKEAAEEGVKNIDDDIKLSAVEGGTTGWEGGVGGRGGSSKSSLGNI
jgi:hypothetical protein